MHHPSVPGSGMRGAQVQDMLLREEQQRLCSGSGGRSRSSAAASCCTSSCVRQLDLMVFLTFDSGQQQPVLEAHDSSSITTFAFLCRGGPSSIKIVLVFRPGPAGC